MKYDNIVVHINSKDISWDIIRMHPNMEYLLLPENADKIMNSIDRPSMDPVKMKDKYR